MANPHGVVRDWKQGRVRPDARASRCRSWSRSSATTARSAAKMAALGPLVDKLGRDHQGRHLRRSTSEVDYLAAQERRRARRRRRRPAVAATRDIQVCRDDPGAVRHHERAPGDPGLQDPGEAHRHRRCTTWPPSTRASRSPSPTPRRAPVPVITSPEWSGSETGGRRYSPVHDQRRAAQAVAHADRAAALLPRPRLDDRARREPADLPAAAEHDRRCSAEPDRSATIGRARGLTRALPDPAHQVVDPLRVPGQPVHAVAVARRAEHLDERPRRGQGRDQGQRLDRGGQPQRRGRRPRDRRRTGCPRAPCTCTTPRTG